MSKPDVKYSRDKKEDSTTEIIKNLEPKINTVYVIISCFDFNEGRIDIYKGNRHRGVVEL